MAYNKSKYVEAAQKLLNQGKVPQAIAEYQQILKYEPRDQVTLMTIGELYIRQGETFQAIDYFERLAQIFVGDGFLTKAIAVYKRIAKLAPEEIRPLEKLADLYVQQGVMSEARPLFLQLAEIHLKNNRQQEAVTLLKKLLLAEPDNLRIQIRLADLYQAMGQTREAVEAYVSAAQRALARGDQAECDKLADKALKLEPNNSAAIIVKARSSSTQGNPAHAAQVLEHVPDLEKGGEQAELLLDIYLKGQQWDKAVALGMRVFEADAKNFGPLQKVLDSLLASGHAEKAMGIIDQIRIPMIDAGEHEVISHLLTELANRLPGRIEQREWLVDMYGRTSDSFRLPDALAQLGDALVAAKQFDRAKATFEQLVDRQPESDSAKRKLNDCLRKLGLLSPEAAVPVPLEAHLPAELPKAEAPRVRPIEPAAAGVAATPAPAGEPALDEETQKFIAQSLTDVDLFASYGLTQKAIGLLEAILRRAPRRTSTLEKLLDFVLGAGDDRRTAELAAQLEQIHAERGDTRSAERFGELRRRFQRAAGLSDEDLAAVAAPPADSQTVAEELAVPEVEAAPSMPAPPELAETPVAEPAPAPAEEVHEVDLSDEWASVLEHQPAPAPPEPSRAAHSPAPAEFEVPAAEAQQVDEFSISEEPVASVAGEVPAAEEIDLTEMVSAAPAEKASSSAPPKPAKPVEPEPEFEVEQDYDLVIEPEPLVPAHDQRPPEKPVVPLPEPEPVAQDAAAGKPNGAFQSDQFLADLANEIDQLGLGELT